MTIKDRLHTRSIIIIITLSVLFSPLFFMDSNAFALSIEEEKILGQKFLAQIKQNFELADDDFANQFFNELGHYLITPLKTEPFPFHFYIIKNNTLNAFAAPGGHIFMFSGLIEALDSIDELAAVLCHEIGHVSARHLSHRIEQSKKIGLATMAAVLAGALIGGKAAGAIMTGAMAAGVQTQLHYSRTDERQADQLGFKYMKAAGFDPTGMISMLKKLEKGHWLGPDAIPAYLLTHPTGPERMSNLDSMLSHYTPEAPKKETDRFMTLFPFFRTIVRATCLDSHEAERVFKIELQKNPDSFPPHLGLGIVYKEQSEYSLAIHHLKKALAQEPDFIPILTNIGDTYQMNGQNREAIRVLEKALKLDDTNKSTLYLLGLSYENLALYGKAIRLFERLASFKPVKNEVYYHLGICYGRENRLALAHYNFGVYFKRLRQPQKARFHFQKAESFSGNNPALREKIHQAMERKS